MIQEVSITIVNQIENMFDEIIEGKRMMNDFLSTAEPWKNWIPSEWIDVIKVRNTQLAAIELDTQYQIRLLLENIRRNETTNKEITDLLGSFDQDNLCSVTSVKKFIDANARIMAKIESLSEFDQQQLDEITDQRHKTANSAILFQRFTSIDDFIQRYYDKNVYLLHISQKWEEQDRSNWYKQLRCFKYLYKLARKTESETDIFRVIDHDLHPCVDQKPDNCVIYHAYQGSIITKDYCQDSSSKF